MRPAEIAVLVVLVSCLGATHLHTRVAAQTSRPGVVVAPDAPRAPGPTTTATTLASVSGRVIGADTGRPLRRARVTLIPDGQRPPRVTTTGIDGTFTFTDVQEGTYELAAQRAGYVRLAHGQSRPLEPGQPIRIQAGQKLGGMNFTLPPMSVISGRITDEQGEPFPGVYVLALAPGYAEGQRQWLPAGEATTDDTGRYRLGDLMPGTYLVMATLNATWTIREAGVERIHGYASTYLPGTSDLSGASRVAVGVGQRHNAPDFPMIPGRMANVSGTVVNSRGEPSEGETVRVTRVIRTATGFSRIEQGGPLAQRDGSFLIRNLAPGDYLLAVLDVETQPNTHIEEAVVVPITVNGDEIRDLSIVTAAAWAIEGSIRTVSGAVPAPAAQLDGTTTTQWQMRVSAAPADPATDRRIGGAPQDNGRMAPDGRFRTEHLFGPVRLDVALPQGWMLVRIERQGRDITDSVIEMGSRQTLTGVEVIVTDRITQLTASVMNARSQPITTGTVVVFAADRARWGNRSRFVRASRPDQFGIADFRGLPPEDYLVVALEYVPEGAWHDPEFLAEASLRAERVSLGEGERTAVTLRPAGR